MKGFTNANIIWIILTKIKITILFYRRPYHGDHAAGPDTVIQATHAHVVRVLSPPHEVLVSHVAGSVIDHEHATLHPDGAAAIKHGVQISAVTHALIVTSSEVSVLIEDNLMEQNKSACHIQLISDTCSITMSACVALVGHCLHL